MNVAERDIMEVPKGYRSSEAGLFMSQLDDQSQRLTQDLKGITPAELEWQPAPGMNTIGMLLAHIAIVEVYWTQVAVEGKTPSDSRSVLGIGEDDDGMPLPPRTGPPAGLQRRPFGFYEDLLGRARAYAKRAAATLDDEDLLKLRSRTRRNGNVEEFNVRWVLYHLLEHFAGHYGQILLLRHQYRIASGGQ